MTGDVTALQLSGGTCGQVAVPSRLDRLAARSEGLLSWLLRLRLRRRGLPQSRPQCQFLLPLRKVMSRPPDSLSASAVNTSRPPLSRSRYVKNAACEKHNNPGLPIRFWASKPCRRERNFLLQRREAKIGLERPRASLETKTAEQYLRKSPQKRPVSNRGRFPWFRGVWMVGGAVRYEPVSARNSLLTGKLTGNFAILRL